MRTLLTLQILGLCGGALLAQSSPSFRLEESTVNAGGHPQGGIGLVSASYRMSLDSVGELPSGTLLQSAAHSIDVGFARCYPPPLEVHEVVAFGDKATFAWAPERSVGSYRVYRGSLHELPGDYGACRRAEVAAGQATLPEIPEVGQPFFYLVSARNMLLEEGTTGSDSVGRLRVVAGPCP